MASIRILPDDWLPPRIGGSRVIYFALRASRLSVPAPFAASIRNAPVIDRFLKNMIIWTWSAKLL